MPDKIENIVQKFLDRTLPRSEWTHAAHLLVGLWHIRTYPDALVRMREGIRAYNEAVGVANTETSGYHETMTVFWVNILTKFNNQFTDNQLLNEIYAQLMASKWSDVSLALNYYNRGLLFSSEARKTYVLPDLASLPESLQNG